MNRGEGRSLLNILIKDPSDTRFSVTNKNTILNLAQDQFALDSKAVWKETTFTLAENDITKTLPTDFMWERRVSLNDLRLDPISRERLEKEKRGDKWTDDKGDPEYYIIDPEESRKTIRPYPSLEGDSKTLLLQYYPKPVAITADATEFLNAQSFLVQYHIAVVYYAAWFLLASDDDGQGDLALKRSEMKTAYEEKVEDARNTYGNSIAEPMQMRGGRPGRRDN